MAIKAQLKGVSSFVNKVKAYAKGKQNEIRKETARSLFEIESITKENVAVDQGLLRASYRAEIDSDGFGGTVGSNLDYAAAQEFGRPDLPKYSYQPALNPAFLKVRPKYVQNIKTIMSK